VTLPLPGLPTQLVREVHIPARKSYAPVPLVVLLDDGPPVDVDRRRTQAASISQLQAIILENGYAVWRPLRDAWPPDSILIRCPDELIAQVQMGIREARELATTDSSHVILLGFGQGGIIGATVAQRLGDKVYALGLIGTPARSIDQILTSPELRDSVTTERLTRFFRDLWTGVYPDTQFVMNGLAGCWRSWVTLSTDLPGLVARLHQPVLAVQGTADSLLPLLDIERFRREIRGRPLSQAHNALGVRHDLRDQVLDPNQNPDLISPRFVPIVTDWLAQIAPLPGKGKQP